MFHFLTTGFGRGRSVGLLNRLALVFAFSLVLLSLGCAAETAATAKQAAEQRQQEVEAAREQIEHVQSEIQSAVEQAEQRQQEIEQSDLGDQ
jgi:hemolysin activation/secretion protein